MPKANYTLPVGSDTRSRHYHRTQARKIVEFIADASRKGDQAKLVYISRALFARRMAITAAEKKTIEKNLDLLFEFEKYVLEHPEVTEKIPRDAIVLMKLAGNQKFNQWSGRWAKRQAKKGQPLISVTAKKLSPVRSRIKGLALEHAA